MQLGTDCRKPFLFVFAPDTRTAGLRQVRCLDKIVATACDRKLGRLEEHPEPSFLRAPTESLLGYKQQKACPHCQEGIGSGAHLETVPRHKTAARRLSTRLAAITFPVARVRVDHGQRPPHTYIIRTHEAIVPTRTYGFG